jgi:hypothetical protein
MFSLKNFNIRFSIQLALFGVLIILSAIFYKERLLADSGYYLLRMINQGFPYVEHHRYILALSQFLPWLGATAGLPLKAILILYSLNHVLFPLSVFLILTIHYKKHFHGYFLVFLQISGITTGFYVPMFEMYYAAPLLLLLDAALNSESGTGRWIVIIFSSFFILSSHPVSVILLFAILVSKYLNDKKIIWPEYLVLFLIFATITLFKTIHPSEYEAGKATAILQGFSDGKYTIDWFWDRLVFMFSLQYASILLILISLTAFVIKRQWLHFTMAIIFAAGILFLAALNTDQTLHSRYNEQVWFPLSILAIILLSGLFALNFTRKYKTRAIAVFMIFFVFRAGSIINEGILYSDRTANLEQIISELREREGQFFVVSDGLASPQGIPGANWSYPIESLLLSAIPGPVEAITICTTEDFYYNHVNEQLNGSNYLFRRFEVEPLNSVNQKYFKLKAGNYIFIDESLSY